MEAFARYMMEAFARYVILRAKPLEMRGNFHMVESEEEKAGEGTVLAVGPDVEFVKVDDVVLFHKYSPETFEFGDEILLVLKEEDIMAKMPKVD